MTTCQCGCGQQTRIAPVNDRSKGWVKGVPLQFIRGHNIGQLSAIKSESALGNRNLDTRGYVVVTTGPRKRQYEHIMVAERALGRPLRNFGTGNAKTEVVHHVRGDKSDNKNLVICTHEYHTALHARLEQSAQWPEFNIRTKQPNGTTRVGSTGFKGVEFDRRRGRFCAHITINRKKIHLGWKATAIEAAMAFDAAAIRFRGDNWITNKSLGLLP